MGISYRVHAFSKNHESDSRPFPRSSGYCAILADKALPASPRVAPSVQACSI